MSPTFNPHTSPSLIPVSRAIKIGNEYPPTFSILKRKGYNRLYFAPTNVLRVRFVDLELLNFFAWVFLYNFVYLKRSTEHVFHICQLIIDSSLCHALTDMENTVTGTLRYITWFQFPRLVKKPKSIHEKI